MSFSSRAGGAATGAAAGSPFGPIGMGVGGALGFLFGGGHDKPAPVPYSGEMEALLRSQRQRMDATNPLYEAVLKMAMGMMPTQYRAGGMPGMQAPSIAAPRDEMTPAMRRRGF